MDRENDTTVGKVQKVISSLYGIPKVGLYYYLTFLIHHVEKFGMIRYQADLCLFWKQMERTLAVVVTFQISYSVPVGSGNGLEIMDCKSKVFSLKIR